MRAAAGVAATAGSAVLTSAPRIGPPPWPPEDHEQPGMRTLRSAAVGIAARLRPGDGWRRGVILQTSGRVPSFAGTGRQDAEWLRDTSRSHQWGNRLVNLGSYLAPGYDGVEERLPPNGAPGPDECAATPYSLRPRRVGSCDEPSGRPSPATCSTKPFCTA